MTQLQSALIGNITPEMLKVAEQEHIDIQLLMDNIAKGYVVLPHNRNRNARPCAIGKGLSTKINANLGTSEMHNCIEEELTKIQIAEKHGAHAVMDLSTGGDLNQIRERMLKESRLILGTVPIYALATKLNDQGKDITEMDPEDLFTEIELQAQQGVDFMTLHVGITLRSLKFQQNADRLLGIVSRGGALLKRWMLHHQKENPLYSDFDRILEICAKHDVTLSLGDGLRPGAISDATDQAQLSELMELGEMVKRSRTAGVQVMVEGPGHVPIQDIPTNVRLEKQLCDGAPFYVLGPLPTDFSPGYDHITGAIGGALAASHGADFLCYVTPAEHLCLPSLDDVKQGVIASRIAAHVGDIAKGVAGAIDIDNDIAKARRSMDWETIFAKSVDPELARERKNMTSKDNADQCSMCGNLCAIKTDKKSDESI